MLIEYPKNKKRLICSISINMTNCMDYTRIHMKKYAERVGADFFVLREFNKTPHLAKYELLSTAFKDGYNKVLYLDADVYIRSGVPDIFSHYQNALFDESEIIKGYNKQKIESTTKSIQEIDPSYKEGDKYYNTGVMIFDRDGLKKLLTETSKTDEFKLSPSYYEQHEFNIFLKKAGLPYRSLNRRWNEYASSGPLNTDELINSYFIHVPGMKDSDQKAKRLASIISQLL